MTKVIIKKPKSVSFPCMYFKQGKTEMVVFIAKSSVLWKMLKINRRVENKDKGYQRALSESRVNAIATYIDDENPIPNSILVSFDTAQLISGKKKIVIPNKSDAGWVIDGQHRFAGSHRASKDINIVVIAFIGIEIDEQIQQFVTVNKEAKGVPSSLYIDLLPHLKNKKPADLAKERVLDIANQLKNDEHSPFYSKIVVTTAPKKGELSLTNFVRKATPLILEGKGILSAYTELEQKSVINNYYKALRNVFPKEFNKFDSIFFQTLGFGALINALPTFFSLSLKQNVGFTVSDATKIFKAIDYFDFSEWRRKGTGSAAENDASADLKAALKNTFSDTKSGRVTLRV